MKSILQNSQSAVVVLHEIYGVNEHIQTVCEQLAKKGLDVYCPDLLGRDEAFAYEAEAEAYNYFIQQVGFDHGLAQVKAQLEAIRPHYQQIVVVGYSVGATIAWRCSEISGLCDGVIGYYGSRIRQYPQLRPDCPVLLFMPREEKSYDQSSLIEALAKTEGVRIKELPGLHGCCDPYSAHFDEKSYQQAMDETDAFLYKNIPVTRD